MRYGEEGRLPKRKEDEIMKDRRRKPGEIASFRQKCDYPNDAASLPGGGAQKLIDELKLFRTLIDQSNDAIMVVDPETLRFLDANEKAYTSLDYSREKFLTLTIPDIDPDFGYSSFEEITRELRESGFTIIEKNFSRKDGSTFPVEINVKHVCLDREYLIAVARDITERKQEEERILRVSSQNEAILEAVPDIIMEVDINRVYTWANQAGLAFFGDDVVGKEANFYFEGEQDTYHVVNPLFVGKDDFVYVESWQRRQDGEKRLLAWWCRILKDRKGDVIGALSSAQDITERKRIEEALRESEVHFRTLADSGQALIWTSNLDKKCDYFNQPWLNFTGRTLEQELGDGWAEGVHPGDLQRCFDIYTAAFDHREKFSMEYRILHASGEYRWIQDDGAPRYNSKGEFIGYIGHCLDITERKQDEEKIRLEEARLESLLKINQYPAENIQQLLDFALDEAISLTDSKIGYVYFYDENKKEFTLNTWSKEVMKECSVVQSQTVYHLEKTGLWGEAVRQKRPIVVNDFAAPNPLKKGLPQGHAMLSKYLTVPIISENHIVAVVGVANKQDDYNDSDIRQLNLMMDAVWKIVQQKRAEETLRESESKYRLLIEHSSDLIWNLDTTGIFTYASPSWERVTGYAPSSIIGKSFMIIVNTEFSSIFPQFIQEIVQSRSTIFVPEYQVLHADETWHWHAASVSPVFGTEDQLISVVGVSRDITEQKQAEEIIRINEARLRRAELASKSGNWELHLNSGEIIASEGAVKLYGFNERVLGYDQVKKIPLPEYRPLLDAALTGLIENDKTYDIEYKIRTADTAEIKDIHSIAIFDKEKKIIFGIIQDITERKRTEEALKESEARLKELNATKDKFFSIVAHDLKSPFNSIIGFSELLGGLVQKKDYEGIKEYASIIQNSSQKVMDLLLNLLEWSRSQTGRMEFNPEYIEISALINNIAELLFDSAQQKPVTVSLNLQHNLVAFADKAMVSTILRNLVSNAIKFTPSGGKITVSTKKAQDDLIISVTDNGVGIKKEDIEKLFRLDENHSTLGTQNEKGTGLGLILCKEFAEKHGGKIWVESEFGKGSTFYLSIPQPMKKNIIAENN